jgi:hypothetical protein
VKVFISYAQENLELSNNVLFTSQKLRSDGVDCFIDQYINGNPECGWLQWMNDQISNADYVLLVCTKTYCDQIENRVNDNHRLGSAWETSIVQNALYKAKGINKKYVPVVYDESDITYIPNILSQYTYYRLQNDYDKLYRYITNQPKVKPQPLGKIKQLDQIDTRNSIFVSTSISSFYAKFNKEIERLTSEQFKILGILRQCNRMKISGCAGSGKTLVAMEQSIRLAKDGKKTLLLCHNPVLTANFKQTVTQHGVEALSFSEWCNKILDVQNNQELEWTQFNEPTSEDIEIVSTLIDKNNIKYDAIIIDEGQDFRSDWWTVVEKALSDKKRSIFYIFYDENQSLLTDRCVYQNIDGPIDLSRNCRNAGDIYKLISSFHRQAPDPELNLQNYGEVKLFLYEFEDLKNELSSCFSWLSQKEALNNTVLLIGNNKRINDHMIVLNDEIFINTVNNWKEFVYKIFMRICHHQDHVIKSSGAEKIIKAKIETLSRDNYPNENDIRIVNSFTKLFEVTNSTRRRVMTGHSVFRNGLHFVYNDGKVVLTRNGPKIWDAEYILHFERDDWPVGIPKPQKVMIKPYYDDRKSAQISVFNIGTFKGLESDSIIILLENKEQMHEEEIYVALSRARLNLAIFCEKNIFKFLPHQVKYYFENRAIVNNSEFV